VLYGEIASGGMATVHFGRLRGEAGFSKTVAVKSLHPEYARDREFVAMFLDEVRIAARIQHPNVVANLDVVRIDDALCLVMEYVDGESLSRLLKSLQRDGRLLAFPGHFGRHASRKPLVRCQRCALDQIRRRGGCGHTESTRRYPFRRRLTLDLEPIVGAASS
jgi:hypothetical protein